jgi:hypothetical protein
LAAGSRVRSAGFSPKRPSRVEEITIPILGLVCDMPLSVGQMVTIGD